MRDETLDKLFREGSKAREVAAILLRGSPVTRIALSEETDVSPTTIPRVLTALERAGYQVDRQTDRSRQVTYHVTGGPGEAPQSKKPERNADPLVRLLEVEVQDGPSIVVEVEVTGIGCYRARLTSDDGEALRVIPSDLLAGMANIGSLELLPTGKLVMNIGSAVLADLEKLDERVTVRQ